MKNTRFKNWQPPAIEHGIPTEYGWTVFYPENLTLGHGADIGFQTAIFCHERVTIGENVQIGGGCFIYTLSTIDGNSGPIVIEEGACLGALCVVMPGVTIGKGARVGAHSFVKYDIEPWSVAYGIPARRKWALH